LAETMCEMNFPFWFERGARMLSKRARLGKPLRAGEHLPKETCILTCEYCALAGSVCFHLPEAT